MSGTFTLAGFAAKCAAMAVAVDHAKHGALEKGARIVEREAKALIGTYDAGWPALKPKTVARKAHGDTPLLETGAMRDSIHHTVGHDEALVGSNDDKAVFQELGTSRGIPPRSFLVSAATRKEAEVARVLGSDLVAALKRS